MEQEFKWRLPERNLTALRRYLRVKGDCLSEQTLRMAATYYETPEGLLRKFGIALRIRQENDRSVCCLKRTVHKEGALAEREEYETEAATLREAFERFPAAGVPADLCTALAAQRYFELAKTRFTRHATLLRLRDPLTFTEFTAEFAVDAGTLGGNGKTEPFTEIELELKSGDAESFFRFANALAAQFALTPEPESKLARAIRAAGQKGEPHEPENPSAPDGGSADSPADDGLPVEPQHL
ncbi:MAG: CYTH domain-containing protein [Oscillospiraceae bacterium]|nr:CYTH domain-containing protein [Oscillospiraceae bacterium]